MASISNTWPEAICLFYKKYIVYKILNRTMHYPQWNYITVPNFMFRCVAAVYTQTGSLGEKLTIYMYTSIFTSQRICMSKSKQLYCTGYYGITIHTPYYEIYITVVATCVIIWDTCTLYLLTSILQDEVVKCILG